MTGWRLGWLVAPPEAVGELEKLAQNLYQCAVTAQHAALAHFTPQTLRFWSMPNEFTAAVTSCCHPAAGSVSP